MQSPTSGTPYLTPQSSIGGGEPPQRPPIKIKIVSWNLGDSLPKGDLTELFGQVPPYEASERLSEYLPDFGTEDGHPYHIIVVANQETPTQSGVPRGLGGGLTKGLASQRDKEKLKERGKQQGQKEAEKFKKEETKEVLGKSVPLDEKTEMVKQLENEPIMSPTFTPHHGHSPMHINTGGKGWSDILEDFFSNGVQQQQQLLPGRSRSTSLRQGSKESRDPVKDPRLCDMTSPTSSSTEKPIEKNNNAQSPPPLTFRKQSIASPPQGFHLHLPTPEVPQDQITPAAPRLGNIPTTTITPSTPNEEDVDNGASSSSTNGGGLNRSPSPLTQHSHGAESDTPSTAPSSAHGTPHLCGDSFATPVPIQPVNPLKDKSETDTDVPTSGSLVRAESVARRRAESIRKPPTISIPTNTSLSLFSQSHSSPSTLAVSPSTESANQAKKGSGSYQFIVKEQLLGLYIAIFVHKDCKDWVEGYDHDFVPTGLMGGRMGNKGGIGISLKMAGHRFLFVCAHLAAHAKRLDARLANIDKIKTELGKNLNCFLPEDDPQAQEADIVERFDTTFWFGDLNFRLDVSRLHADWLVQHKEFDKALEFDQLRIAMREGKVFDGFAEGDIDFAPTFKYDVWHSAKKTRRKERKENLSGLSEVEEAENGEDESVLDDQASFVTDTTTMMNRRTSVDSSVWSSARPMDHGDTTDGGDSASVSEKYQTVPQQSRPISAVAKTGVIKFKYRIKNFLKRAGGSNPPSESPSDSIRSLSPTASLEVPGQHQQQQQSPQSPRAREASMSRQRSRLSIDSTRQSLDSDASRPGLTRNVSKRLRGMSFKKDEEESSSDSEEDTRKGVYDTSSKQRVPSWCDRVLWRTHVEEEIGPQPRQFEVLGGQARIKMFGHYIADKLHRKPRESGQLLQRRLSRLVGPPENGGNALTRRLSNLLPDAPATSSATGGHLAEGGEALGVDNMTTPRASVFEPLNDLDTRHQAVEDCDTTPRPPNAPTTHNNTNDLTTTTQTKTTTPSSPVPKKSILTSGRRGSLPENLHGVSHHRPASETSFAPGAAVTLQPRVSTISASGEQPSVRKRSDSWADHLTSTKQRALQSSTTNATNNHSLPRTSTTSNVPLQATYSEPFGAGGTTTTTSGETSLQSAKRWFSSLPGLLLHPRNSVAVDQDVSAAGLDADDQVMFNADPIVPVRRRKGEVDCLEYTTIDDVGMRKLEGRSDHRPIIFAAAVWT